MVIAYEVRDVFSIPGKESFVLSAYISLTILTHVLETDGSTQYDGS